MISEEVFFIDSSTIIDQAHKIIAQGELAVSWEERCM